MVLEDLTPELRAKAEACTTADEVLKLAKTEGVEVPVEWLQEVGGGLSWSGGETRPTCPRCQSESLDINAREHLFRCRECGHQWSR